MFQRALLSLAAFLLACVSAFAAESNTFETTLANGLKVIVKEDRRAPSVVHMVWYRVGARDEIDGTSGVAHVLEHMMFKGTKKMPAGTFNKRVAAVGGRDNAFTSQDYTAYFQQVPPNALDEMMALEADRMTNLQITDDEFGREIEVVKEERRLRTDDRPRSLVYEQLQASAFEADPYRRPVIGWMGDLERLTAADARDWYRSWYVPNNAYVVVVGDVEHSRVFALARKHYGAIAARKLPERRAITEPPQRGPKSAVVRAPADLPYLMMAWHVPTLRKLDGQAEAREHFALQALAAVLDGYDGARLNRKLVRDEQVAISAGAGFDGIARGSSLFMLDGVPAKDASVERLREALQGELARVAQEGISDAELERVKVQTVASEVYKRDSLMGQAMEVGMLEAVGFSWRDEQAMLDGIKAVTAAEVQAVAKQFLSDAQLTVATLDPLPLDSAPPRRRGPAVLHGGGGL
jgi:zinc protease